MTNEHMLKTYSCRAEIWADAMQALHEMWNETMQRIHDGRECCVTGVQLKAPSHIFEGDSTLEFRTTFSLDELMVLFERVPDSHVMRETLRAVPLAENYIDEGIATP